MTQPASHLATARTSDWVIYPNIVHVISLRIIFIIIIMFLTLGRYYYYYSLRYL